MSWFYLAISKWLDYKGRSRRREYWWFSAVTILIIVTGAVCDAFVGTLMLDQQMGPIVVALVLLSLIPGLPLTVRRLHDIGRSGWWTLIGLTGIGGIVLTVIGLFNGDPKDNRYGPSPKLDSAGGKIDERPLKSRGRVRNAVHGLLFAVLIVGIVVLAGRNFIYSELADTKTLGDQRKIAGRNAGQGVDETECLRSGLERVKSLSDKTIKAVALEGIEVTACIEASRYVPNFCEGVPPESTEIIATSQWIGSACNSLGLGGVNYCIALLQGVARYCTSPVRQEKVDGRKPSES